MKLLWPNLAFFLLLSLIASILLFPISSNIMIPDILDFFNHLALIKQAKLALLQGQFPLRVAPTELVGFHYPLFQFYSPTSYTIAGLIYLWLTPDNVFMAYKATLWCCLVAGGYFMYRLANWFVQDKSAAILASIAYLTSPYFIILTDHMAAFNELIALCILPAVLYYTFYCYYSPGNLKSILQMAFVWYLLATIHLITFVYTSCFITVFLFMLALKTHRSYINLMSTFFAYSFGCLLAIWFLAPIQLLAKDFMILQSFIYWQPISLAYLFSPIAHFGIEKIAAISIHPSIGYPMLLAVGICLYARLPIKNINKHEWIIPLLTLFFVAVFLMWIPLNIWNEMPDLFKVGQYRWRLFGQIVWIGALLFAWVLHWLLNSKIERKHVIIATSLLLLTTLVWLPITELKSVNIKDTINNPIFLTSRDASYLISPKDGSHLANFTDHSAHHPAVDPTMSAVFSIKNILPFCDQTNDITRCVLPVPTTTKLLELPIFYYPELLNIIVNGHAVPYISVWYDYYLVAGIAPEAGQVNVIESQFRGLLWANYLSVMAWMLWLFLLAYAILRRIFPKKMA